MTPTTTLTLGQVNDAPRLLQDLTFASPPAPPLLLWWHWPLAAVAVVGVTLAGVLAGRALLRWLFAPPPPHKLALRSLSELLAVSRVDHDRLIVEVARIVCDYLKQRFEAPAPSFTPTEMATRADTIPALQPAHRAWLAGLGRSLERSRYAGRPVDPIDAGSLVEQAERLVVETYRFEQTEPNAFADARSQAGAGHAGRPREATS